jgi:hypothetical protein
VATRSRILFIGNSFTARHDVPALVALIGRHGGRTVEHRLISAGGASLRRHWNAGAARVIADERWDAVVLQEQSTLPARDPERLLAHVRLFQGAVAPTGAALVLYATWARADAPDQQTRIDRAYSAAAAATGAAVAAVGAAWTRARRRRGCPVLHDRDGSHASTAGAYLAACVLARTILGVDPVGAPTVAGLDEAAAGLLQAVAAAARAPRRH